MRNGQHNGSTFALLQLKYITLSGLLPTKEVTDHIYGDDNFLDAQLGSPPVRVAGPMLAPDDLFRCGWQP